MRTAAVAGAIAVVALTGACNGSSTPAAAPSPSTATTPVTEDSQPPAQPTQPPPSPASQGCPAKGSGTPKGATSGPVLDVDGDGKRDTGWLTRNSTTGAVTAGITTASGATMQTAFSSASPVSRTLFVGDATGKGQVVELLYDGRQAELYRVQGCQLQPVLNPQKKTYTFDFGFTGYGTGVGCSTVRGAKGQTLVGLNSSGSTISRTQVIVDGLTAKNGLSDTVPKTSASDKTAHEISCGDLTAQGNGISLAE